MDGVREGNNYLFDWQHRVLHDVVDGPNKYGVLEKSRRIGGTWVMAIAAVEYCLKTGQNCWFSSSDEKNGREFVLYVRNYCEVYNAVLGTNWIDLKVATTESVTLPNGARVSCLSSNPRALRGKDGLVILDEVALHQDQEELVRAAQGCVIQKGKLWLLSTHDGPATVFYRLASEAAAGKEDWDHHRVTLEDAVNEGYARKFVPDKADADFISSVRRSCISEDAYLQEYLCRPLSLKALISGEEYDAMALWDVPDTLDPDHDYRPLFVGIDVGRSHDLTVLWVLEQWENPKAEQEHERYDYRTVCVRAIRNQPIPAQYQQLRPLIGHRSVQRVLVDLGSVGRPLADAICDEFADRAEPFSFTQQNKAALCERVKGFVQGRRVSLPKDAPLIRQDILAMQRSATKAGNLTYDGHTKDTHCDYYMGLAMALEAAASQSGVTIVGMN